MKTPLLFASLVAFGCFVTACSQEATVDSQADAVVEFEKSKVQALVTLIDEASKHADKVEQQATLLIGARSTGRKTAALGQLVQETGDAISALVVTLRDIEQRVADPQLSEALRKQGYLSVPDEAVTAQLERIKVAGRLAQTTRADAINLYAQLVAPARSVPEGGAQDDTAALDALDAAIEQFTSKVHSIQPALIEIRDEFSRWIAKLAVEPTAAGTQVITLKQRVTLATSVSFTYGNPIETANAQAAATRAWEAECTKTQAQFEQAYASTLVDFDCGAKEDVTTGTMARFASTANLTFKVPMTTKTKSFDVRPETNAVSAPEALNAWQTACTQTLKTVKDRLGVGVGGRVRVAQAATCGVPTVSDLRVAPYGYIATSSITAHYTE